MLYILPSIKQHVCLRFHTLQERVSRWIKPPTTFLVLGTFADLTRSKVELLAENALLRQQVIILRRQIVTYPMVLQIGETKVLQRIELE